MYVKRIQILNYGPIDQLDVTLPFDDDKPKPILLIGENGSGKSIVLSHIVNALIIAKDIVYPDTREVESGKVYKLRSSQYIKLSKTFYFARVDFENNLSMGEIWMGQDKIGNETLPIGFEGSDVEEAWKGIPTGNNDNHFSNVGENNGSQVRSLFSRNCVLFFPPNRFEDPAWLNESNLTAQAGHMNWSPLHGSTERRLINYSPLRSNRDWLYDVAFDRAVLEIQTPNYNLGEQDGQVIVVPVFAGFSGEANNSFESASRVIRSLFLEIQNIRFGIGRRRDRAVSLMAGNDLAIPNIFQLSTGETALLNLFMSILRDYELSGASFNSTEDIRGIVVVDEIDLHLHVSHQYSILPNLIKMFPKVQFIVTTHSPLFILGMRNVFGEGGFGLYRMPGGNEIDPEEFSEFESAYESFTLTSRHTDGLRSAIEGATKPIVVVEGTIDQDYIVIASKLLNYQLTLAKVELHSGNGAPNLNKIWNIQRYLESYL